MTTRTGERGNIRESSNNLLTTLNKNDTSNLFSIESTLLQVCQTSKTFEVYPYDEIYVM